MHEAFAGKTTLYNGNRNSTLTKKIPTISYETQYPILFCSSVNSISNFVSSFSCIRYGNILSLKCDCIFFFVIYLLVDLIKIITNIEKLGALRLINLMFSFM